MKTNACVIWVVACGCIAASSSAAVVNIRIVERTDQREWTNSVISPVSTTTDRSRTNNIFNFSVQMQIRDLTFASRVFLGGYAFDIVTNDTVDKGVFSRLRTNVSVPLDDVSHVWSTDGNLTNFESNTAGSSGVPRQYASAVMQNGDANGQFTGPASVSGVNQIVGVVGRASGSTMLDMIGFGENNPLSYTGISDSAEVGEGEERSLWGGDGNWFDVYRFNYTATSDVARNLRFSVTPHSATVFSHYARVNGEWGLGGEESASVVPVSSTWTIRIVPAPNGVILLAAALTLVQRRRQ